jgi:pimeloyl-ACP methyl ester carboxylesterase
MAPQLSERVQKWRDQGRQEVFRGQRIHVYERPGSGPVLLLLHGFPSSSFDWRALLDETDNAVLTFDFLGFGLSDKPRDHTYTLAWQADLVEDLAGRLLGDRPVFMVAHDMGTSVATELLARQMEAGVSFRLVDALLFNGSIVLERASLTPSQKLLRGPLGPLAARLSSERFFRHQFGGVFSDAHPLSDEEAADQWALLCHNGGRSLGHKLVHYLDERVEFADRWHGAIRDWSHDPRLRFVWGTEDPVATTAVLDALIELRPHAPVTRLEGIGHYPQIEDPQAIGEAIRGAVAQSDIASSSRPDSSS